LEGLFGTAEQFEGGGVAVWRLGGSAQPKQAIAALRLAIDVQNMASESTYKQQTQEPVAWRAWFDADNSAKWLFTLWPEEEHSSFDWQPLYTTPPQRTWVGLTHEEHMEIMTGTMTTSSRMAAVEAKLKEKNT
jgi:hypothetical protein